jgi:thymidylate synthase (FAD)
MEDITKAKSYKPTTAMVNNAKRGLALREKYGRGALDTREAGKQGIGSGVAREVARGVLPVNIYSSMFVTMNARSLMNFLSLRTMREGTQFPSFPQREIEMVAEMMESLWAEKMPITYETFNKNGRVTP